MICASFPWAKFKSINNNNHNNNNICIAHHLCHQKCFSKIVSRIKRIQYISLTSGIILVWENYTDYSSTSIAHIRRAINRFVYVSVHENTSAMTEWWSCRPGGPIVAARTAAKKLSGFPGGRTKCPLDKMSPLQNAPGQNVPRTECLP